MAPQTEDEIAAAHATLYAVGLEVRTPWPAVTTSNAPWPPTHPHFPVLCKNLPEIIKDFGWGWVWARPGLERKTRSMLIIAMLCALNRMTELAVHVRSAMRNGCTEEEIREVLLQVAVYVGMPAGLEGTRVAEGFLKRMREEAEAQQSED